VLETGVGDTFALEEREDRRIQRHDSPPRSRCIDRRVGNGCRL